MLFGIKKTMLLATSIEFKVDLAGHLLDKSDALDIHPIIDGVDLFASSEFDSTALEFDEVVAGMKASGKFQIFNCTCGIPECGGWEDGVVVDHRAGEIIWSHALGSHRFLLKDYTKAVECAEKDLALIKEFRVWKETTKLPKDPVVWAVASQSYNVLSALLACGAKVIPFSQNAEHSPFVLAILRNDRKALKLLLASQVNLEQTEPKSQRTILHIAAMEGATNCVKYLLAVGADISAMDVRGWTALDLSLYEGHDEVSNLLRGLGCTEKSEDQRLADRFGFSE